MRRLVLIALGAVACGDPTAPGGVGRVRIALVGTRDTIRFEVPVTATRCAGGTGLLVHGERRGQGVLLWLRGDRMENGTVPLLTRGDTVSTRGAMASVRFMTAEMAHGLTLDDGAVTVTRATAPLELSVRGRGVETTLGLQRSAEVSLERVTLASDSTSCRVQP